MDFLGLFRRETDESELSGPARRVLSTVRCENVTPEAAAVRENVPQEDLRKWMREPAFRAALRRKPAPATVIDMRELAAETAAAEGRDPHAPPPPGSSEREIEAQGWTLQ